MIQSEKKLILTNCLRGGGAERVCVTLTNELAALKEGVELGVFDLTGEVYLDSLSKKVKLHHLEVKRTLFSAFKLRSVILKVKPKIVLCFSYEIALFLVILRPLIGEKFKLVLRNRNSLTASKVGKSFWYGTVLTSLAKWQLSKVDFVVAQSNQMADDLISQFSIQPNRLVTIYNPVAKKIADRAKKSGKIFQKKQNKEILFVGRLDKQKRLDVLLDIFAACLKEEHSLKLRIIGKGPERDLLVNKAQALGIADSIIWMGFVSNVEDYYLQASLTLLTSDYEGLPNVLLESITLGTPVVSFDCPSGPSEIIIDGVNGYLHKLGDTESMKKSILSLCSTNGILDAQNVQRTAAKFEKEHVAKQYQKLFAEL